MESVLDLTIVGDRVSEFSEQTGVDVKQDAMHKFNFDSESFLQPLADLVKRVGLEPYIVYESDRDQLGNAYYGDLLYSELDETCQRWCHNRGVFRTVPKVLNIAGTPRAAWYRIYSVTKRLYTKTEIKQYNRFLRLRYGYRAVVHLRPIKEA